jgi:hypothetical protein
VNVFLLTLALILTLPHPYPLWCGAWTGAVFCGVRAGRVRGCGVVWREWWYGVGVRPTVC